jgi:hypothetical protein
MRRQTALDIFALLVGVLLPIALVIVVLFNL